MKMGPLGIAMDSKRLEHEQEHYQHRLDEEIDSVYRIASEAKKKGLDFSKEIETVSYTHLTLPTICSV